METGFYWYLRRKMSLILPIKFWALFNWLHLNRWENTLARHFSDDFLHLCFFFRTDLFNSHGHFLFPANFNQTHQKFFFLLKPADFLIRVDPVHSKLWFRRKQKKKMRWLWLGGAIDSSVFSPITGCELILPKLQKWENLEENSNGKPRSDNFTLKCRRVWVRILPET